MSVNTQRALATIRNWNECFPIGTEVCIAERVTKTWSWAGLGKGDEPVVFVEDQDEPVPLVAIKVDGWEMTGRKR